jgi:hypothetical protein
MGSLAGVRSRWAAIGAACAVALGAGGFGVVNAVVSSGEKSVFVPVSPIRVLDTRDSTEIANGTRRLVVEGAITVADGSSQLVVPSAASAVAVNITATSTRKNGGYGFVTVFPCVSESDAVPNASSLNFETGVDIANALSVSTSANGSICLYVYGTADLIVDVAGYYVDHDHDDRYYTEGEVDAALADKADVTSLLAPIVPSQPLAIDSAGQVGLFSSIAIGANGSPIISYREGTNDDLKVAACDNPTCTASTNTTIDSAGRVGYYTSIAIGANGNPVISYWDTTNLDLKVAACDNPTCTTSTNTTIDSAGVVGSYSSIAIGINGNPVISYHDGTSLDLKVAACNNPTCTGTTENDRSTKSTIDSAGQVGYYTSIAIGINGNPVISYHDGTSLDLKVAACNNPTCTTSTNTTIDSAGDVGYYTSIAIGINGNPIISYLDLDNFDLEVAACNNPTCTASTNTTIDSAGDVGYYTSIAIGTHGNPIISYSDQTNGDLGIAACNNPTCTTSTNTTIDSAFEFDGFYTSIAIGANGNPIISYGDITNGDLKVFSPWWMAGGR